MEKSGSETTPHHHQWFYHYLVKIKTKVVPTELPSYICQVGQKIRCHTLFEKKRRSDYFAVTFGLLQVICVK